MKKITYIFVFFLCALCSSNYTFASGWVTADNGNFYLNGAKWFPYGTNYFPSHYSHIIEPNNLESWYKSPYYTDNLVSMETDLAKIQDIGFNSAWIVAYPTSVPGVATNFVDFLQRMQSHNLKAGVSLSVCNPFLANHQKLCHDLITSLHDNGVTESDTVFAYDLAWEVVAGQYSARNNLNKQWTEWIISHY